ncbi:hypothetical protein D3C81_683250 [compost metagenome]
MAWELKAPLPPLPFTFGEREGAEAAFAAICQMAQNHSLPFAEGEGEGAEAAFAAIRQVAQNHSLPFAEGEGEGWGGVKVLTR